ncbi:hypothetical protein ABT127_34695 [Streptomyces sp. NPDC001904]|uniref:hypothetical protein n=1 Tax=Streptomyces sp. NPDC001904 TaxID=3154531 RepID=UPI00332DE417
MAIDVVGAHYTTVFNQAVRDRRLSRRARGLLVELLSHQDGYGMSLAKLVRNGPEGRDALATALGELEDRGYLHRARERDARGRLKDIHYYLTDMPAGVEIVAPAPWTEQPASDSATPHSRRSRRSEPKSDNPEQAPRVESRRSEPRSGFPVQAEPVQEEPPPKKNNFKKTTEENTNSFPPSAREDDVDMVARRFGESVLLSIARHHPELHAALATGSTLADQAPLVASLLEAGVSRENIREALVGRPYPPPHERTHSLAALVAARLRQLAQLAAADAHARDSLPVPPHGDQGTPSSVPVQSVVPPMPECPGQDGTCGRPVPAPGDLCRLCG